jgi:hypothetical protein
MQSRSDPQNNVIFRIAPIHDPIRQKPVYLGIKLKILRPVYMVAYSMVLQKSAIYTRIFVGFLSKIRRTNFIPWNGIFHHVNAPLSGESRPCIIITFIWSSHLPNIHQYFVTQFLACYRTWSWSPRRRWRGTTAAEEEEGTGARFTNV